MMVVQSRERRITLKMRLCSKCGVSLIEIRPGVFSCPRGHGEWGSGVVSVQVKHFNDGTCGFGGKAGGGSSSKGRSRKKPQKKRTGISNIYLDPYL